MNLWDLVSDFLQIFIKIIFTFPIKSELELQNFNDRSLTIVKKLQLFHIREFKTNFMFF